MPTPLAVQSREGTKSRKWAEKHLSRHIRALQRPLLEVVLLSTAGFLELVATAAAACPTMSKHPPASRPVVVTGAALMCSTLAQQLVTRNIELSSEIFAWAVLPVLVVLFRWPGLKNDLCTKVFKSSQPTSNRPKIAILFTVAVAAASWYRSEEYIVVLFPSLTPLLLARTACRSTLEGNASPYLSSLVVPTSSLIAAFSCFVFACSNGTGIVSLAVCVGVAGVIYTSYIALARSQSRSIATVEGGRAGSETWGWFEGVGVDNTAIWSAPQIVPSLVIALLLRTFVFHAPNGSWVRSSVVGIFKAFAWILIFETTKYSSWCIATTINTFSMAATRNPYIQTSGVYALCHVIISVLSLGQTICMLPRNAKKSRALWILAVVPIWPLLTNVHDIHTSTAFLPQHRHPIEALAADAVANFEAMLARQSRNYTAAVTEYRRRYELSPPPGFESWFNYATARNSPIIDEFDMIHEAIAPFLKLTGRRVREAMQEATSAADLDLWSCEFNGATGSTTCRNEQRTFDRHISESLSLQFRNIDTREPIPDVQFLVNHLDEPRVLLPSPQRSTGKRRISITRFDHQSAWRVLLRDCSQGQGTRLETSRRQAVHTYGIPFVTDTREDKDLCQHQHEYGNLHGLMMSPVSFSLIEGTVPVLSTGTLSTMSDVLFPSPAYNESEFAYDEIRDVAWDRKRNNLYWAGSTTGGYAASASDLWKSFHRQRLVALAQGLDSGKTAYWYLREGADGLVRRVSWSFLNSRAWDVAFTRIFQCEGGACGAQRNYFRVQPRADKDAALRSRLAFDVDGNGISGRFVKLLASRSAPLKQTLLREWHDERLAAWLHYIPVSLGMEELPELVNWLTGSARGQQRAETIAEAGRTWAARALRAEDRAVYVYRVMLELARLQDAQREAL